MNSVSFYNMWNFICDPDRVGSVVRKVSVFACVMGLVASLYLFYVGIKYQEHKQLENVSLCRR